MPQRNAVAPSFGEVTPAVIQATAGTAGVRVTSSGQASASPVSQSLQGAFGALANVAAGMHQRQVQSARDAAYLAGQTDQVTGDIQEQKYGYFTSADYHEGRSMAMATAAAGEFDARITKEMNTSIALGETPEVYMQRVQAHQAELLGELNSGNISLRPQDHERMIQSVAQGTTRAGALYSKQWDQHLVDLDEASVTALTTQSSNAMVQALGTGSPAEVQATLNQFMSNVVEGYPRASLKHKGDAVSAMLQRTIAMASPNGGNSHQLAQSIGTAVMNSPAYAKLPVHTQAQIAGEYQKQFQEYVERDVTKYTLQNEEWKTQAARDQIPNRLAVAENLKKMQDAYAEGTIGNQQYEKFYKQHLDVLDAAGKAERRAMASGDPYTQSAEDVEDAARAHWQKLAASGVNRDEAYVQTMAGILVTGLQQTNPQHTSVALKHMTPLLEAVVQAQPTQYPKGADGQPEVSKKVQATAGVLFNLYQTNQPAYYAVRNALKEGDGKLLDYAMERWPKDQDSFAGLAVSIARYREDVRNGNLSMDKMPATEVHDPRSMVARAGGALVGAYASARSSLIPLAAVHDDEAYLWTRSQGGLNKLANAGGSAVMELLGAPPNKSVESGRALDAARSAMWNTEAGMLGAGIHPNWTAEQAQAQVDAKMRSITVRTGLGAVSIPSTTAAGVRLQGVGDAGRAGILNQYAAAMLKDHPDVTPKGMVLVPAGSDGMVLKIFTVSGGAEPLVSPLISAQAIDGMRGKYEQQYTAWEKGRSIERTITVPDLAGGAQAGKRYPVQSLRLNGANAEGVPPTLWLEMNAANLGVEGFRSDVYKDARGIDTVGFGFANVGAPGASNLFTEASKIPPEKRTPAAMAALYMDSKVGAPMYYRQYAVPELKALGLTPGKGDSVTDAATKLMFYAGYHSGSNNKQFTSIISKAVGAGPSGLVAARKEVQTTAAWKYASAVRRKEYEDLTQQVIQGLSFQGQSLY